MSELHTHESGPTRTGNPKADAKAAKAYAKATRSWYQKKRWWLASALVVIMIASVAGGSGEGTEPAAAESTKKASATESAKETAPEEEAEPVQATEPEMTAGQANALQAAENYLSIMAFSRSGLIGQLSSSVGDGYSKADATFAADNVEVNWNQEAAEAAQNYLDTMPFSRDGLIQQLTSAAGDGFTKKQAIYGVDKAGL